MNVHLTLRILCIFLLSPLFPFLKTGVSFTFFFLPVPDLAGFWFESLSVQVNHDECMEWTTPTLPGYYPNNSTIVESTSQLTLYYIRRSDSLFFAGCYLRQVGESMAHEYAEKVRKLFSLPSLAWESHTFLYNATLHNFSWEFMAMCCSSLATSSICSGAISILESCLTLDFTSRKYDAFHFLGIRVF